MLFSPVVHSYLEMSITNFGAIVLVKDWLQRIVSCRSRTAALYVGEQLLLYSFLNIRRRRGTVSAQSVSRKPFEQRVKIVCRRRVSSPVAGATCDGNSQELGGLACRFDISRSSSDGHYLAAKLAARAKSCARRGWHMQRSRAARLMLQTCN